MIYGNINDINQINKLSDNKNFKEILDYLKNNDINLELDNKYQLNDDITYFINKLNSKPFDNIFEAHKDKIDFFYVLEGTVDIYVSNIKNLEITNEYDSDKDIMFGETDNHLKITLNKNDYIILFPEDGHSPSKGNGDYFEQIVFKIKV